jgi:hypothetical protein
VRQFGYLAVEGPTDVEFVGRLLRPSGLKRVERATDLDRFWERLIGEKQFPYRGSLTARIPAPGFFQNESHSVAAESAGGIKNLVTAVESAKATLGLRWNEVSALGVFADADWDDQPTGRFQRLKNELQGIGLPVSTSAPGEISDGHPRLGIYVFPDNRRQGTLEDLLNECAAKVYPGLLDGARAFVSGVDRTVLSPEDFEEVAKPPGEIKARLGCVASLLVPGSTLQVSVARNRWLRDDALAIENIAAVHAFLKRLLGLNA